MRPRSLWVTATLVFAISSCKDHDSASIKQDGEFINSLGSPVVGVRVTKQDRGYRFEFKNCTNQAIVPLVDLVVQRAVPLERADEEVPLCKLVANPGEGSMDPWSYGEERDGYVKSGECAPLAPGQSYRILSGTEVTHVFKLGQDGAVVASGPICD